MAALDRAVAFAEVDDVAVGVGEHLDLDVVGVRDELFEQQAAVAEGGLGFAAGALDGFGQFLRGEDFAHAAAAAAAARLQHHGVADTGRFAQ